MMGNQRGYISNPSPQNLSFLRCLPYTTSQHPVMLRDTAGEKGDTSHPPPLCFVVKQNIGGVARSDGGVNSFRILEIPADA